MTIDELTPNETESKAIVVSSFSEVIASVMNEAQFNILQGRTPKEMIKRRPGKGGKTFSYVPHGYVTAQLNRAFGFDWDFEIVPNGKGELFSVLEGEAKDSRPGSVLVHGKLTVRIRDPHDVRQVIATITKSSTGEKEIIKGMTWGGLVKSAESDAFKKCASRLGVALDLYWQDTDEDYLSEGDVRKARSLLTEHPGMSLPEFRDAMGVSMAEARALRAKVMPQNGEH